LSLNFSGLVQDRSHPGAKYFAPLTKSGHLAFKIVIKRQSTDITHSLQCALEF